LVCLLALCSVLLTSCESLDGMVNTLTMIDGKVVDRSGYTVVEMMERYDLTEEEYSKWLNEAVAAVSDPQSVDVVINESKEVIIENCRVKLPVDEHIISIRQGGKLILTDEAMYEIDPPNYRCNKINYANITLLYRSQKFLPTFYQNLDMYESYSSGKDMGSKFKAIGGEAKLVCEKLENLLSARREKQITEERKRKEAEEKRRVEELAAQEVAEKQKIEALLAWDDTAAKVRAKSMKGQTIVFKSFYLGMPIEDAMHLLYKKMHTKGEANFVFPEVLSGQDAMAILQRADLQNGVFVEDSVKLMLRQGGTQFVIVVSVGMRGVNLHGLFVSDAGGKVTRIMFDGFMIDRLFGSSDLDGEHFVEQFRSSYKIPSMEVVSGGLSFGWSCTTKDGAKLTIDSGKNFWLEKVASSEERAKAFD